MQREYLGYEIGQVKRTHNIETAKIVSFLKKQGIEISDHPNSKLTDEQLVSILDALKPKEEEVIEVEEIVEEKIAVEKEAKATTPKSKKEVITEGPKIGDVIEIKAERTKKKHSALDEDEDTDIEVIRAPKQKVEGLKVLGKINLPEPAVEEKIEEVKEESIVAEEKQVHEGEKEPLSHLHPTKKAKFIAKEKLKAINAIEHKFEAVKKTKKEKSISEKLAENKKVVNKKKKANPHKHIKKSGIQSQRIEVTNDGTILPKNEQKPVTKEKELSFFAKIWKWFNT